MPIEQPTKFTLIPRKSWRARTLPHLAPVDSKRRARWAVNGQGCRPAQLAPLRSAGKTSGGLECTHSLPRGAVQRCFQRCCGQVAGAAEAGWRKGLAQRYARVRSSPDQFEHWLSGDMGVEELKPGREQLFQRLAVSKRINSSKADSNNSTLIDAVRQAA